MVAFAGLLGVGRRKPPSLFIDQQACQKAWAGTIAACLAGPAVQADQFLNLVEDVDVNDSVVVSGEGLVTMHDLTEVGAVFQQMIEGATAERLVAGDAVGCGPAFGSQSQACSVRHQSIDRPQSHKAVEQGAHRRGLRGVDDQLAVDGVVAERRQSPHPHALLLRGRDLVADALARDLALELGERQQNVQGQPSHRGRRIERLGDGDERGLGAVEDVDDLGEVGQRPGQPVDLVDDYDVDPPGLDLRHQCLQRRSLEIAARISSVVIGCRLKHPAFVLLAFDEGLTGLALGVKRVEGLFEALLARLTRIDCAAQRARERLKHCAPPWTGQCGPARRRRSGRSTGSR